ncbi:MAG: hypothetical protein WCP16_04860 [Pseudanabaena sp. ELA645]|jgi:chromosome segregation ATPase
MTPEQIDNKLADHDRWFTQTNQIVEANIRAIEALTGQTVILSDNIGETNAIVDSNIRAIEALTGKVITLSDNISETRAIADSNARVIQSLCDLAAEDRQERQQIMAEIAEIQSEVRGMQTENRRILDILLNQNQQNNDNN